MTDVRSKRTKQRRTVLVTGAQRGIGYAIARRMHTAGYRVALLDMDSASTQAAAKTLDTSGETAWAVRADVTNQDDVLAAVEAVRKQLGPINILVNNAGISPKHNGMRASLLDVSIAEWRRVLDVNLTGALICSQACVPDMIDGGWGRIVNISSQAARTASKIAGGHYAASKAGLLAFSRVLVEEVSHHGITVNSIAPGRILTPMASEVSSSINDAYLERIPVKRLGTPEDIAAAVEYLASEEASFISGAILDVNGGSFMP